MNRKLFFMLLIFSIVLASCLSHPNPKATPVPPTAEVTSTPLVPPDLKGSHDGAVESAEQADCRAYGWITDANQPGKDVQVRVQVDGKTVVQSVADQYRLDLWLRWVRRSVSAPILPLAVFSVVYGLTISFTVVTEDHFDYYDDRYQWPLFIPFLVFFFLTIEELVLPHIKPARRKLADWLIFTAFILWAVYPLTLISKFVSKSLENGVVAYNMYNTRTVRQSPLVSLIMQYPLDRAIPIYTNYPALIYFLMERRSLPSPFDPVNFPRSQQYLLDNYQGRPGAEKAYDIYFITNDHRHYFSPWELKKVSRIEKIGEHSDGGLYLASPK